MPIPNRKRLTSPCRTHIGLTARMRFSAAILLSVAALLGVVASSEGMAQPQGAGETIYLQNAHLYDATMSEPTPPRTLVIRDGRIA